MALLAASTMAVSACSPADSESPVVKLVERKIVLPPESEIPCPPPAALPDRAMTSSEVTSSWGADRTNLAICEQRRSAAVAAIRGPQ